MSNAPEASATSPETIDTDTPCRRCGYNLRGLSTAGQCPECGIAVRVTMLRHGLRGVHPDVLRRIRLGARITYWSLVAMICSGLQELLWPIWHLAILTLAAGVWLLTSRAPGGLGQADYGLTRRAARVAVIVMSLHSALALARTAPAFAPSTLSPDPLRFWAGIVRVFASAALLQYLQKFAARIPDQMLVIRARFLKVALPMAQVATLAGPRFPNMVWFFSYVVAASVVLVFTLSLNGLLSSLITELRFEVAEAQFLSGPTDK